MKFKESILAHKYLDGLKGIEIGGSAHNPFGLDTINVDKYAEMDTVFKLDEQKLCGEKLAVDVVANGDNLPFEDNSFDFVISSHVIEHFFDPIKALKEWHRVATKYIFIIVPNKNKTFDKDRKLTPFCELMDRHKGKSRDLSHIDTHHSVWDYFQFMRFMLEMEYKVVDSQPVDDKVGNGFTVIINTEIT